MLPKRLPKQKSRHTQRLRSPAHRAWVRGFACVVPGCEGGPIEFAHVKTRERRSQSARSPTTAPVCPHVLSTTGRANTRSTTWASDGFSSITGSHSRTWPRNSPHDRRPSSVRDYWSDTMSKPAKKPLKRVRKSVRMYAILGGPHPDFMYVQPRTSRDGAISEARRCNGWPKWNDLRRDGRKLRVVEGEFVYSAPARKPKLKLRKR